MSCSSSSTGTNDWTEYFSNSNQTWCWMSKSRKVTYLGASRSQMAVFKAGWVILPSCEGKKGGGENTFYNVFSGKKVSERSEIPEYVDPSSQGTATAAAAAAASASSSRKRPLPEDDQNDDGGGGGKKAAHGVTKPQNGNLRRMKTQHKWIQYVLLHDCIHQSSSPPSALPSSETASILDLSCGSGACYTLLLHQKLLPPSVQKLEYVGIDSSRASLDKFIRRVRDSPPASGTVQTSLTLSHADLSDPATRPDIYHDGTWTSSQTPIPLPRSRKFDLVCMPFSMGKMCRSKTHLENLLSSFAPQLRPGGYFVATVVDPNVLRRSLRAARDGCRVVEVKDEEGGGAGGSSSRVCCRMEFDEKAKASSKAGDGRWGWTFASYRLTLTEYPGDGDEQPSSADSSPGGYKFLEGLEYVLPMTVLIQLAWKQGNLFLVPRETLNFENFSPHKLKNTQHRAKLHDLQQQLSPHNNDNDNNNNHNDLNQTERNISKLYQTLVFQKGGNGNQRRIAIVVPFRDEHAAQNRSKHLAQFVPYMVQYMSRTLLPFHIFIIEQSADKRKFNRGKLLNAGYRIAKRRNCSAFIFHDVDLLPDEELLGNYRCDGADFETVPDHIARVWKRYSGNKDYIGGVTAFSAACFERLNGFPNNFWGWGGEDDEVRNRLAAVKQHFSSPKTGSLRDLENMTIQQKIALLRKQNTDREGSDNTWKCMVKNEILKAHSKTWRENGLFHRGKDGARAETELFSRSKEDVHPSGFASKITVELTKNDDRWDTVTSWKDL